MNLGFIQDLIILGLEIMALGLGLTTLVVMARSNSVGKLKKRINELENEKEKLIKKYENKIAELEEKHRQELEIIGRTNTMLKEIKNALDSGAVKLVCPKHPDAQVEVLADGTILCGKGHRLWPRGEEP